MSLEVRCVCDPNNNTGTFQVMPLIKKTSEVAVAK